jgi:hypothetical protein
MNKLNLALLASTCLVPVVVACANKAQNEPQTPAPVMMTPAAGTQPAAMAQPAANSGQTPQGAKVTPLDTTSQPTDGGISGSR